MATSKQIDLNLNVLSHTFVTVTSSWIEHVFVGIMERLIGQCGNKRAVVSASPPREARSTTICARKQALPAHNAVTLRMSFRSSFCGLNTVIRRHCNAAACRNCQLVLSFGLDVESARNYSALRARANCAQALIAFENSLHLSTHCAPECDVVKWPLPGDWT
jgi:hypothetical protein